MERPSTFEIAELIRRAELRLEQYVIARQLTPDHSPAALAAELRVNASLAMLAYLRSLQRDHAPRQAA